MMFGAQFYSVKVFRFVKWKCIIYAVCLRNAGTVLLNAIHGSQQ